MWVPALYSCWQVGGARWEVTYLSGTGRLLAPSHLGRRHECHSLPWSLSSTDISPGAHILLGITSAGPLLLKSPAHLS